MRIVALAAVLTILGDEKTRHDRADLQVALILQPKAVTPSKAVRSFTFPEQLIDLRS